MNQNSIILSRNIYKRKRALKWTKEIIEEKLNDIYIRYGKINIKNLSKILKKEKLFHINTLRRVCGRPTEIFNRLNIPFNAYRYYYSKEKNIERLRDLYKKYGIITRKDLDIKFKGETDSVQTLRRKFGSIKILEKEAGIKIKTTKGCIIGNKEEEILNKIEENTGLFIERQYSILGYFVDGYNKKHNIVFEVDERQHNETRRKKYDKIREYYIKNFLHCQFIHILEKSYLTMPKYLDNIIHSIKNNICTEVS